MKKDRIFVFLAAAACCVIANLLPNTFVDPRYGQGFPRRWTHDPTYKESPHDTRAPYEREYTPRDRWKTDATGVAIDASVALGFIVMVLAVNEIVQINVGNRPPRIPPHLGG